MGNIIISALTKAERLARYRMASTSTVTEAVTTLVNGADDVAKQAQRLARKAKYNSQFQSNPNVDTFVREASTTMQTGRINPVIASSSAVASKVPLVRLDSKEMAFFSENLKGIKPNDIEQAVSEILALENANGLTGFTRKLGHKSAYSTRALLEAKFNDPQRYDEILTLIRLNKEGKIKYFPSFVMPNGKTNPLVKQDMEAILSGKNYYEQFSRLEPTEILAKTKLGDVFSVGDKMYVRDVSGYIPLKMDKKTYELLFPPVDRYAMAQGASQNCGAIAVINNMVQVPSNRVKLLQLYEQNGNKVTVHALGDTTSRMTFDLNDLKSLDDGILSDTSYGLKMLERKGQLAGGKGGYSPPSYTERTETFFVPDINKTQIEYMSDTPLYISKQQIERELATIGNGRTFVTGGGGNYALGTGNNHWCSVYDYKNGTIRFANPNATADYKDVPISEFIDDYLGIGVFHNH
ncbi:hypothetical protein IKB17_03675 [bacterium]|nr:hypothetical protein [bacterium]